MKTQYKYITFDRNSDGHSATLKEESYVLMFVFNSRYRHSKEI